MKPALKIELYDLGYRTVGKEVLSDVRYDISDCISYDDDISIMQTRDGISGMFINISTAQTFYLEAYNVLRELYEKYQLFAYGRVAVSQRDRINVNKYNLLETFELDFSTIQIEDNQLSLNVAQRNLKALIDSNAGTKYDIKEFELPMHYIIYERMLLEFTRGLIPFTDKYTRPYTNKTGITAINPQITHQSSKANISPYGIIFRSQDAGFSDDGDIKDANGFLVNQGSEAITVNFNYEFDAKVGVTDDIGSITIRELRIRFSVYKIGILGYTDRYSFDITNSLRTYSGSFSLTVPSDHFIRVDFEIRFSTSIPTGESTEVTFTPEITNVKKFDMKFTTRSAQSTTMPAIYCWTVNDMLRLLVSRMTNTAIDTYKSSIEFTEEDSDNEKKEIVLAAAEIIRGFTGGYYHTSFSDFRDFMQCLGYEYYFPSENEIRFVNYETLFKNDTLTGLSEDDVNNLQVISDTSHSYTNIEIGYKEQSYESENGRFTINGTFNYSTGLILSSERTLNMVSPYRSDQIGMELLLFDRAEITSDTTDNRSDNDIFAFRTVHASSEWAGPLRLDSEKVVTYSENEQIQTLDAALSPPVMAERWKKYLGISTGELVFASTTANRTALINGLTPYSNISCPERLFSPVMLKMDAKYIQELYTTNIWMQPIEITYFGRTYRGYLNNSERTFGKETSSTLELFASADSFPDPRFEEEEEND